MGGCRHGRLWAWEAVGMGGSGHGRLLAWEVVGMAGKTHLCHAWQRLAAAAAPAVTPRRAPHEPQAVPAAAVAAAAVVGAERAIPWTSSAAAAAENAASVFRRIGAVKRRPVRQRHTLCAERAEVAVVEEGLGPCRRVQQLQLDGLCGEEEGKVSAAVSPRRSRYGGGGLGPHLRTSSFSCQAHLKGFVCARKQGEEIPPDDRGE
eukprot:350861-Chlamydomonas_euryale.AAC.1